MADAEHADSSEPTPPSTPSALPLISCGDASENYAFKLNETNLEAVLSKIEPKDRKVAVVSVVGAFRTGKSFLLTLLLRYLRSVTNFEEASRSDDDDWLLVEGDRIAEGNANDLDETDETRQGAFRWRAGRQRMTTGISIWSEPFELGDVAVLIVDTQGLFDNETTMALTSCIFGLSTLMSSYQIYNVANRIQEDNLQQLALFTEYGRMAVDAQDISLKFTGDQATRRGDRGSSSSSTTGAARRRPLDEDDSSLQEEDDQKKPKESRGDEVVVEDSPQRSSRRHRDPKKEASEESVVPKPFQRLEFLVRDWTELDDSMTDDEMETAMQTYLDEVLATRAADDLAFTRDQIFNCFQSISCRLLPHPGFAVTKLKYDGEIAKIDPLFVRCVRQFASHVFASGRLEPKKINGEELTATQLANYVRAYVGMFADGARFPQATTMLEATATANTRNAKELALDAYHRAMDRACGTHRDASFLTARDFTVATEVALKDALALFDTKANMGRKSAIEDARKELQVALAKFDKQYALMNDARNPFKNAEFYVLPLGVATLSWLVKHVTDAVCPEDGSFLASTCNRAEHALHQFYTLILFLMLLSFYFKFRGMFQHVNTVLKAAYSASLQAAKAENHAAASSSSDRDKLPKKHD